MDSDLTWCADDLDGSAARFMARVDTSGSCWLWTGPPMAKGYGYARLTGARRHTTAHRVAYMLATGRPIPPGLLVRHSCDTPACVFPGHLLLGTHRDNVRDAVERGRTRNNASGPLPGNASTVHHLPRVDHARAAQAERRALYGA